MELVYEIRCAGGIRGLDTVNGQYKLERGGYDTKSVFKHVLCPDWTIAFCDAHGDPEGEGACWSVCASDALMRSKDYAKRMYVTAVKSDLPPCTGWMPNCGEFERQPSIQVSCFHAQDRKRQCWNSLSDIAWKKRKFTDAEVVCGNSRFAVHRVILSAASPVFDVAFSSSLHGRLRD
eukprot:TRINITY_DN18294_c0_g1_i1.p1 TRINITY_DN18294_c0_g1~~TRINITY_DN18294_c0_g1_i1.p1  ORF type:complete len:177 (+),score=8.12 TRINITY_DN18294_c0_g1_i1:78-608(+)